MLRFDSTIGAIEVASAEKQKSFETISKKKIEKLKNELRNIQQQTKRFSNCNII